ncbi:MAG: hypothetical protein KGO81_15170 [Bacteroidota bacterium]|nr:hypothetical protein [Bacteroidota bacterium]
MGNEASGRFAIVGGTLLSVSCSVTVADLLKSVVLAVVGAVTSFAISEILKRWWRK